MSRCRWTDPQRTPHHDLRTPHPAPRAAEERNTMVTTRERKTRAVHCGYCGEYIGQGEMCYVGQGAIDEESCGKPECNRAIRESYEMDREERRWQAEQDDYSRY